MPNAVAARRESAVGRMEVIADARRAGSVAAHRLRGSVAHESGRLADLQPGRSRHHPADPAAAVPDAHDLSPTPRSAIGA